MKRVIGVVIGAAAVVRGCAQSQAPRDGSAVQTLTSTPPAASTANASSLGTSRPPDPVRRGGVWADDRIIARINGEPITMGQFLRPLVEAHGLQMLVGLVQLELAKQDARAASTHVLPEDVRRERELTLEKMFADADKKEQDQLEQAERKGQAEKAQKLRQQIRDDREQLLTQYLQNKNFTATEFDLKIQINAYLRKQAEQLLRGKLTDEMVQKEFGVEYGETVQVRYIQLDNEREVGEARRRLAAGEEFGAVARLMSRNARAAAMDGQMIPFSRQTPGLPDAFKQLAFSLQPGQVSDTLSLGGHFFILKLEQKFPPKAVKFESVKEPLRQSMYERLTQNLMQDLYSNLGRRAETALRIEDPTLKKQFEQFMLEQQAAIHDRQRMEEQWKKERAVQGPATEPATQPAAAPATQP